MALSLIQIKERLRTLNLAHKQVNDFKWGDPWEFEANGNINYPVCCVEILPGSIDRAAHLRRYNFRFYYLDLVSVAEDSEGNEDEVLSDMDRVGMDMVSILYGYEDLWEVAQLSPVTTQTEVGGDSTAGVYVDVQLSVPFTADRCQVPIEDVEFEETFDMARTRILTYTGTGGEGDSFTVSNLSGKVVLAVYRAGDYRRAIVATPTVTDKIKVTGTDLGDRKGILSSDGTVGLVSGDALVEGGILDFLIFE